MSVTVGGTTRLKLPGRIRSTQSGADATDYGLMLADRIASLPGIAARTDPGGAGPRTLNVYLDRPYPAGREHALCRVSRDGLAVYGLSDRDRHQVLRSSWGRLQRDHVLLHLPRDKNELETCWRIVQHAFFQTATSVAGPEGERKASPWDLPRFSRTSLQ